MERSAHLVRAASRLAGPAGLLSAMTAANAANYAATVILSRWLGPAAFGDVGIIVTAILLLSIFTSGGAAVMARAVARAEADGAPGRIAALRTAAGRPLVAVGLATGLAIATAADGLAGGLRTGSSTAWLLLAAAVPIYLALGIDRGVLQGRQRYARLGATFIVEATVRLVGSVAAVAAGYGSLGAIAAIGASIVAAWAVGRAGCRDLRRASLDDTGRDEIRTAWGLALPTTAGLVGQLVISNSDMIIVKYAFSPSAAGGYLALALVGRIVFFASVSLVGVMLPAVAARDRRGEAHLHLFLGTLAAVGAISGGVAVAAALAPSTTVALLFGDAYRDTVQLVGAYAAATALLSLVNVVVAYQLAVGRGRPSYLVACAALPQVGALLAFHEQLADVVLVQVAVAACLLVVVSADAIARARSVRQRAQLRPHLFATETPAAETLRGQAAG